MSGTRRQHSPAILAGGLAGQASSRCVARRNSGPRSAGYLFGRTIRLTLSPILFVVALLVVPVAASERAEDFVKALHDRGLDELILDYLDRADKSRLVSDEFRRRVPYHRGMALLSLSRRAADPDLRSRRLAEARAELTRFAGANPASVEGAEAQIQLGGVLIELGRQNIAAAGALPAGAPYDAQRKTLRDKARGSFSDAGALFRSVSETFTAALNQAPTANEPAEGADQSSPRSQLRARLAQAEYLAANVKFETAQCYAPDSAQYRQLHESAARDFAAICDKYSSASIWGYYARLDEGRSYQALGQFPLAIGCYQEIISRSAALAAFRPLISRAHAYEAECLVAQQKFDAAIEFCQEWLSQAADGEQKQPEWLAVRFQLAEALRRKGEVQAANSSEGRRLMVEARNAYRLVAAAPGTHQPAARTSLVGLKRGEGPERAKPKTFAEAFELGKEALASANAAKQAIPTAEKNNPEAVPDLQAQVAEGNDEARHDLQLAVSLVDDETDRASLNQIRYFLSWLYWEDKDYYRAAVLGDFLARRYPDHPAAAPAARIAIAAYERLEQEAIAAGGDRAASEFAARRAADTSEFVNRRWPGTRDAEAALAVLVRYAIRNDRIEDATRLLAGVPADARPQLEMQLGISMWARYVELSQREEAARPPEATIRQIKEAATNFLRQGIDAARAAERINELSTLGAIYLAQALLSQNDAGGAIALIEDPKIGPLTLLSSQHPAAARPGFAIQVYETALRAYVAATPPRVDKVLEMMQSLEQAIEAGGGELADQLTRVYVGLGVQLQRQIDDLRAAGRDAEAARVAAAFAQFLDRIAARKDGLTWSTRQWLAQSYYNLGARQKDASSTAPASPKERQYLTKARDIYESLLNSTSTADPPPTEAALLATKFQFGECLRELGQFEQALDTFSAVLQDRESTLAVQRAAALAYQQRGQAGGTEWFERSIFGGYKLKATGENRVWGWLKLSQVADRAARTDPKFRDTFFEARVNIARCRYLAALQMEGEGRKLALGQAKQNIQSVARLYPEMGGERRKAEFDALLKQVQTATGEKAVGLQEFASAK